MAIPANGYLGNPARTTLEFQTGIDDVVEAVNTHETAIASLGTAAAVDVGVSSGNVPTIDQADSRYLASSSHLNQGSNTQDPNLTTYPVILSKHANTPSSSSFWHITTTFYSTVSSTSNRGQVAVEYNGNNGYMYSRSCYGGVWTPWAPASQGAPTNWVVKWSGSATTIFNSWGDGHFILECPEAAIYINTFEGWQPDSLNSVTQIWGIAMRSTTVISHVSYGKPKAGGGANFIYRANNLSDGSIAGTTSIKRILKAE